MEAAASVTERTVLEHLGASDHLEAIDRGVRWRREEGETCLWFESTTIAAGDRGLCTTAIVETVFDARLKAPDEAALAWLNRRAVFGNFLTADGRLVLRASFSIRENEQVSWQGRILTQVMGDQLALGYGIVQSEAAENLLSANRVNLEYPRRWAQPPDAEIFRANAARFSAIGVRSAHAPQGLSVEIPLDGRAPSAETALLRVVVDVPHPLAGVGYLATIALPSNPVRNAIPRWCCVLNRLEHEIQDFAPRLGAWGVRGAGDELVYSMFWPADRVDGHLDHDLMAWMIMRALWIRERFWSPGTGFPPEPRDG